MRDTLPLKLRRVSGEKFLDCIVCRRMHVDAEIRYGTVGGHAAQGIHLRCIGRALAIRGGGPPEPTTKTYEDGLREAASIAASMAWDFRGYNDNPVLRVHQAIRDLLDPRTTKAPDR